MNSITQAQRFVNQLRQPADPRQCPFCGWRYTKKHGTYPRTVRDLGGVRTERWQRYWCHPCHCTYTPAHPNCARYQRYARRVQRKALDVRLHFDGSLRKVADLLRTEISPGSGRASIWDPLLVQAAPVHPKAKLAHSTLWRWQVRISQQALARHAEAPGVWAGAVWQGRLVADATYILIAGVLSMLHLIGVAGNGLILRLQVLQAATTSSVQQEFRHACSSLGATWDDWQHLMSDGASVYQDLVAMEAPQVTAHRCLFHLWRNAYPRLQQLETLVGDEIASAVEQALRRAWQAPDVSTAQRILQQLANTWFGFDAVLAFIAWVQSTLAAVLAPQQLPGMPRSSNAAELRFERYKRRYRMMHSGFMSRAGAQSWQTLWQVYANAEPTQIRHESTRQYHQPAGQPLLERAGLALRGLSWLDLLQV